jgi:hypothetical protein
MEAKARADFVGAYTKILTAAWSNDAYAAKLASDPKSAVAEYGLVVQPGATVNVIRETGGDPDLERQVQMWETGTKSGKYDLLVPVTPHVDTRELSEADLEAVSGGDVQACCCCCPCCTCT